MIETPKRSSSDSIAMYSALIALFGMAMLMTWATWEALYPYNYFKAPAIWQVTNENKVVKPGGEVFAHLSFEKTTDLPAELGLMMTGKADDGRRMLFIFPKVSGAFPRSKGTVDVSVATLPHNTPPGSYKVDIVIWYRKIFRTITHTYSTEVFRVE